MNRKSHQLYDELSSKKKKENFTQVCEQLKRSSSANKSNLLQAIKTPNISTTKRTAVAKD